MNDVVLEIFRALVLAFICVFIWREGRHRFTLVRKGWGFLLGGFLCLLFATVLDVTDNFESLNVYVVVGDTATEAFLETLAGYWGFILLAVGLIQWVPTVQRLSREISERKGAEEEVKKLNQELGERVEERTRELEHELRERKRIEQALREGERRIRLITDAVPGLIAYVDADQRYRFVNRRYEEWYGVPREEIIGRHVKEVGGEAAYRAAVPYIQAALSGREVSFESERQSNNDTSRHFQSHFIPHFGEDGKAQGYFALGMDITGRMRAEEEIRKLNEELETRVEERTDELRHREQELHQARKMEAVGQLTGGIAHDFNNLLAVIMGNLELLDEKLNGAAGLRDLARRAIGAADRGATLTQRLLAFSRKQTLKPRVTNANELILGMLEMLGRTLGETIDIQTMLATAPWMPFVDPGQLENAILNLALNARDAMPEGGKLTIETANSHLDEGYAAAYRYARPGQYVMLAVSDTGAGMGAETVERAFEPFFTTKEIGDGSGLGLSMVYGFVKQSGGHVNIYSEVGHGTTMKIYLPRATGKQAPAETEPCAEEARPGKGEKILVVEDDAEVRKVAVSVLTGLGYNPIEAADGGSALVLLDETPEVVLLFTDVVLPGGMGGHELARAARRRHPGLKVLFVSGYTQNAIAQSGELDEGVELIEKPYRKAVIAQRLSALLSQNEA